MSGFGKIFGFFSRLISSSSAKSAAVEIAKWAAFKILITTVFITGLAILLNNFLVDFMTDTIAALSSELDQGQLGASSIHLKGLGAYLAVKLRLVESFSVFIAGVVVGGIRSFIPFL